MGNDWSSPMKTCKRKGPGNCFWRWLVDAGDSWCVLLCHECNVAFKPEPITYTARTLKGVFAKSISKARFGASKFSHYMLLSSLKASLHFMSSQICFVAVPLGCSFTTSQCQIGLTYVEQHSALPDSGFLRRNHRCLQLKSCMRREVNL